jgi:hypothetical protein
MTPEMTFECLLVSHDPAVFSTMDRILKDFSIHTNICPSSGEAASLLADGGTDLIVIDLESENSSQLMRQVWECHLRQKPTILALSSSDRAIPGVHVVLRKPLTTESSARSVRTAYSRMLQDYRQHTRFAVMAPVQALDENHRVHMVTVTNIGAGGIGFTSKDKVPVGSNLSLRLALPGLKTPISIQARVLWTREYGATGCEFSHISSSNMQLIHAWLESRYRIKKPLISLEERDR